MLWILIKFVFGIVWLLLTIGVIVHIWTESKQESLGKLLWTAAIILMPYLGPVLWMLLHGKDS